MNINTQDSPSSVTDPINKGTWQPPSPLIKDLPPEIPYPLDALPSIIQRIVSAYQTYGQQPLPLIASAALANISLACQSLANVARDRFLTSPVSLYFLTIAHSGERKSAADNLFSNPIRQWERTVRKNREPQMLSALTQHKAWQMERDGLLVQIKRSIYSGEDADYYKQLLEDLVLDEPEIPIQPSLYFEDTTQEALAMHLAHGWPTAALWSDEAGIILGSQSMQSNATRFVALLNRLWDGKTFTTHRKSSQNFVIEDRRLTLSLMMQPLLLNQMVSQASGIHRQSGFLARCFLTYPQSAMGNRFYQEPPQHLDGLNAYEERIVECLNSSQKLCQRGCIKLPILSLSPKAKQTWIQFYNGIESGLKPQGQWIEIKDFASKSAENATRLAALFHIFGGKEGDINMEDMEQAISITAWHLQEAQRVLAPLISEPHLDDARLLINWIIERGLKTTTSRELLQYSPLRDRLQRDNAVHTLLQYNQIRISKEGKKTVLEVNPRLF